MTRAPLIPDTPRRRQAEPVVPMINVVFLLLIFFLMTARIAPPDPFEMTLPTAEGGDPASEVQGLYLSATGEIAFGQTRGEAALAGAHQAGPITLHADAQAPATALASVLARLTALGATEITLVTEVAP